MYVNYHEISVTQEKCVFLNHGAFGAVLKGALSLAQAWQSYIERQPLRFFDRELLPFLAHVTHCLAGFVGSDATDIVLVTNATTAINSVVRSMDIQRGDKVYMLNLTYGAVKKLLQYTCDQAGATLQEETVRVPVTDREQIISLVQSTLKRGTKLAVFDHIPSNTPFVLPIQELVEICRERDVPVLIDGAHALGMLQLDMKKINADFYVSNAHKWFCCPKGSAFMYVRKELQSRIRPLIISHGFGSGFNSEFVWAGLHDYSPFLVMPALIEFWKSLDPDKVRRYMHGLCREAGKLLQEMWDTTLAAPPDMFGAMCLVGLPESLYKNNANVTYDSAEEIQNELFHKYNIEVPVKAVQGRLYMRISCHIHNELEEYKTLGQAVLDIVDNKNCISDAKKIKR
ncbi:hypothetical protein FSP39_006983 [Pinctada imbricata]|uniref:Aminotransferase class V domain-containing protein n=1 Tax=Pinctada imbricata TaxID=66713 RepID=A0AA88Y7Z2_PINIB|nr:hypothetical protein FSP39_006983 [Pinctada imbricata]